MHILHIETGMHLYGGALQVFYLLRGLQKNAVKNTLVCPEKSSIGEKSRSIGVDVLEVPFKGDLDVFFLFHLIKILKKKSPQLVHIHSRRGADIWGGIAARMLGIPAIITRRVDNPEPGFLARKKYKMYEKVITISEGIKKVVLSAGIPSEKVVCVRSAIDLNSYAAPCAKDEFHEKLAVPGDAISIGTIAQLIPRKGHADLINVAPLILKRFPNCMFLFFGKGPLLNDLKKMSQKLSLQENLRFLGFRDDLQKIIPCLDLVIHPAHMEGLGVSLIQASASGVPIVASRAGGIPEIVRHEENGLLFEPGDINGLFEAASRILSDKRLAQKMGLAGKELAFREFSLEKMVKGNLKIYQKIGDRKSLFKDWGAG